jgi:hypothetical protein
MIGVDCLSLVWRFQPRIYIREFLMHGQDTFATRLHHIVCSGTQFKAMAVLAPYIYVIH